MTIRRWLLVAWLLCQCGRDIDPSSICAYDPSAGSGWGCSYARNGVNGTTEYLIGVFDAQGSPLCVSANVTVRFGSQVRPVPFVRGGVTRDPRNPNRLRMNYPIEGCNGFSAFDVFTACTDTILTVEVSAMGCRTAVVSMDWWENERRAGVGVGGWHIPVLLECDAAPDASVTDASGLDASDSE